MNDERLLELERYFDGELSPADRRRVADEVLTDAGGREYLQTLLLLRRVARRHRTADEMNRDIPPVSPRVVVKSDRKVGHHAPQSGGRIVTAVVAGSLLLTAILFRGTSPPRIDSSVVRTAGSVLQPPPEVVLDALTEAQLFLLVNGEWGRSDGTALRVSTTRMGHFRRSSRDAVAALWLANSPDVVTNDLPTWRVTSTTAARRPSWRLGRRHRHPSKTRWSPNHPRTL